MSQSWTWPPVVLSDGAVEGMKWLGLFLMTADHAQKYGLMLAVPGVYEVVLHTPDRGRAALMVSRDRWPHPDQRQWVDLRLVCGPRGDGLWRHDQHSTRLTVVLSLLPCTPVDHPPVGLQDSEPVMTQNRMNTQRVDHDQGR